MSDEREEGRDDTELRRAQQHLDLVLELADITAARVDTDLRHVWVHDEGPESFAESAVAGKRDDELFPPEVAAPTLELKRAVLETGEPITRTVQFQKPGGDRTYRIRAEPMRDGAGNIEGVMQAAVDISEAERQRQQLQVATRMLRHNLRNRVTALLGQAEILDEQLSDLPEPETATRLQRVLTGLGQEIQAAGVDPASEPAVQRTLAEAERLAADLSDLSKVDACATSRTIRRVADRLYEVTEKVDRFLVVTDVHRPRDTSVRTAVGPVLESVRAEATQAYPDATITVADDADASVSAPSNELRIGVLELVENAVEHNDRPHPTVEIRTTVLESGRISIAVADDGPGIPDHEARVIEEMTESPLEHGSGIGLWLAQWVSNKHGGPLRIDNRDDGGSVVSLTLAADTA